MEGDNRVLNFKDFKPSVCVDGEILFSTNSYFPLCDPHHKDVITVIQK